MMPRRGGIPGKDRWRTLLRRACGSLLACLMVAVPAAGAADSPLSGLTLRVENDVVDSSDANYTSGVSLAYTRNDSGLLGGVWGAVGPDRGRLYSSYELAQLIFTPKDLNRVPPDPHDRPYAGVLYLGMATGLQTETSLQALKLLLGVVGPSSLGESGQRVTHKVLIQNLPKGWDYQLKDEPLLNLTYEYRRRYRLAGSGSGFGAEFIPIATAMLGNYLTKATGEGELRFGYHLPDDFGDTTIRGLGTPPLPVNGYEWGIYLFVGGGGELIARDITLDGNTFRSGPSVKREPFVSSGVVGLALRAGDFLGSFSYLRRGREFAGQVEGESYGSLSLTYLFR